MARRDLHWLPTSLHLLRVCSQARHFSGSVLCGLHNCIVNVGKKALGWLPPPRFGIP